MKKIEDLALGIVLGAVPILACSIAFWWGSIPFVPEAEIFRWALGGLFLGILLDAFFLRGWVRHVYSMKTGIWIGIYLFYSVGLLGFFMGVPVFNLLLALPAGIFVGRWLSLTSPDRSHLRKTARQTAMFTSGILGLVCITSAALALASPSTGSDLQGMLGLASPVTPAGIIGIIVAGGVLILALDWWLTIKSVELSHGYFAAHSAPHHI